LPRKQEQELTNGIASNSKVSEHQKKQLLESRDNQQNGRKIFASYKTDEGLISRIHKELK
jgi:hypothetical protein